MFKAKVVFALISATLWMWVGVPSCAPISAQDFSNINIDDVLSLEAPPPQRVQARPPVSATKVIPSSNASLQPSPITPSPITPSPIPSPPITPTPNNSPLNTNYQGWELLQLNPESLPLTAPSLATEQAEATKPDSTEILMRPWWINEAGERLGNIDSVQHWELDAMISSSLENSPFIQSALVETQIYQSKIGETLGPFDATAFVDSIFKDTSDPVGNTLDTGAPFTRLNQIGVDNRVGIRKKNFKGGTTELTQQLDLLDSNSQFFIPEQQASTKLRLGYTQPLMRGSGIAYNRSTIVVAELAADASEQVTVERIQDHVFKLTVSYWELVTARAYFRQNKRALALLVQLRDQLAGRADLDSLQSQLWRADSAISRLQATQAKVAAQITAAEAKLRAAIGAPELREPSQIELIPSTMPADWKNEITVQQELANALNYHPKVQAIKLNLQSIRLKMDVAEQDLRPTLDLVLDGYLRGLNGDYQAAQAWTDQFSIGTPSYSGGLVYQRSVRNSASRAILRERRLELRRSLLDFDQTLMNIEAAVIEAAAQVDAAFSELESSVRATLAIHAELEYLTDRWKDAFRDDTQKSLTLDQLLNAQLQLVQSENNWAKAQADHMIAIARLKFVTATLLSYNSP